MEMSYNARIELRESLKSRLEEFHADHDQSSHGNWSGGVESPMGKMMKNVWTRPDNRKTIAVVGGKKNKAVGDDGPRIVTPGAEGQRVASEYSKQYEYTKRENPHGYTAEQLDGERDKIRHLMRKGKRTGFQDRVDAETRAQAVAEGRIADKKEIDMGRKVAVRKNWPGLLLLGIVLT